LVTVLVCFGAYFVELFSGSPAGATTSEACSRFTCCCCRAGAGGLQIALTLIAR